MVPAPSSSASSAYRYNSSSRQSSSSSSLHQKFNIKQFSSLAQDWDGDDNGGDNKGIHHGGGGGGIGGSGGHNHQRNNSSSPLLLPISHSRKLPPSVCPTNLRSEVESIFDATIGSLIVYSNPGEGGELKSVEEEIAHAYYASDGIVQRVEYIMRGLNAMVSEESFVARSLKRGVMSYEEDGDSDSGGEERMGKEDCFRAMLDLMERMAKEGEAYDELRTRMRSQLVDPSMLDNDDAAGSDSDSSSSSSSDDSDSSSDEDSDGEGGVDGNEADKSFDKWEKSMTQSMSKAGYPTGNAANDNDDDSEEEEEEVNEEDYQFGADPGITTHMYDLVLDSLACLCQEQYGKSKSTSSSSSSVDLAELMPAGASPPELAKELLDAVLNRHWMDGGDIGLGGGGSEGSMNGIAGGVGVGAGTGAGALAGQSPFDTNFDVRTCPTPMTFNAVIRIAANFDPVRHAEAVENAKVLSGAMGLSSSSSGSNANNVDSSLKQEQDRLRDVTIDAALSTYSRMQVCSALTLRSLKASTKRATSRSALKRQAKLLADSYKKKNGIITGRNSATYAYLIQTLGNCIPPSLSRGNMTFAMYHKGCVKEGVMDEQLITAMRAVGGYDDDEGDATIEDGEGAAPPPPVSNGPLFDSFMQKELGDGVAAALENGRRLRQDRNYKLRRHVEWDDTY